MTETPYDHFVIERHQVEKLRQLASRLFTQNRMDGDAMRDAAQLLRSIVDSAFVLDDAAAPNVELLRTIRGYLRTMIDAKLIVRADWMDALLNNPKEQQ